MQYVAVRCSVLQCVTVHCSVLQCVESVAVRCSVWQRESYISTKEPYNLIAGTLPPRVGFLFGWFPFEEAGGRGPVLFLLTPSFGNHPKRKPPRGVSFDQIQALEIDTPSEIVVYVYVCVYVSL